MWKEQRRKYGKKRAQGLQESAKDNMSGPCGVRGRRRKETNEGGVKLATFIFRNSLYPLCGKPTRIWKFVMRKELQ